MTSALTQLLEILQSHGLMDRSDEGFVSAMDLVELDAHLEAIATEDMEGAGWRYAKSSPEPMTVQELIHKQRREIDDLEQRIGDAIAALT